MAVLAACRAHEPASDVPAAAPAPQRTRFDLAPYPEGPLPPTTQLFLVAGGDDIANFAQEVTEQGQLWRESGTNSDSIACYWAKPKPDAFKSDQKQYNALADHLAECRRAEPATVRADLLRTAEHKPSWVYLFVTSHGLPPLLQWQGKTTDRRELADTFSVSTAQLEALDQHSVGLQAGPGPRLHQARRIASEYSHGDAALGDLMLSPQTLAKTLSAFPAETVKIVVLQACFSGGFIGPPDSPLTQVPNIVILTATAPDRPSFGCGAGTVTTHFGGAFNKALARRLGPGVSPLDVPWREVWDDTVFIIDAIEAIDGERPSAPSFYANVGGLVVR